MCVVGGGRPSASPSVPADADVNPAAPASEVGGGSGNGGDEVPSAVSGAPVKADVEEVEVKGESAAAAEGAGTSAAPAVKAEAPPAPASLPITSTLYIGIEINRAQFTGTTVMFVASPAHKWDCDCCGVATVF